jgi:hypothetical protein
MSADHDTHTTATATPDHTETSTTPTTTPAAAAVKKLGVVDPNYPPYLLIFDSPAGTEQFRIDGPHTGAVIAFGAKQIKVGLRHNVTQDKPILTIIVEEV